MAGSSFRSAEEFREVIDEAFRMMSDDPDMGPRLREADTPQRFEFTDVELVLTVRAGGDGDGGENLVWEWGEEVAWKAKVRMSMSSEIANRFFQGKENVAMAIARRRIKAGGDVRAALALITIAKPVHERYRSFLAAEHPHLIA